MSCKIQTNLTPSAAEERSRQKALRSGPGRRALNQSSRKVRVEPVSGREVQERQADVPQRDETGRPKRRNVINRWCPKPESKSRKENLTSIRGKWAKWRQVEGWIRETTRPVPTTGVIPKGQRRVQRDWGDWGRERESNKERTVNLTC